MGAPGPSLARRAVPLAAYWALGMAPFGLTLPYLGLYLRENAGLSGAQIGAVFAVTPAVGILMQPIWGALGDRSGLRARMLVVLSLGVGAGMLAFGRADGFAQILLASALLASFARALIPMLLSVSLPALEDHVHAFGWVRAFGTIGFGAAMFAFPSALAQFQAERGLVANERISEPGLGLLFPTAAALSLLAACVAMAIPNRGAVALRAHRGEWKVLLRNPRFLRVLAVCTIAFLCINGPMELFPIFVRERGGDLGTVRDMWLFMLVPEVALAAGLGTLSARLGARTLLAIGLAAGSARWLLTAAVPSLPGLHRRGARPQHRRAALRRCGRPTAASIHRAGVARHRGGRHRRHGVEPARGLAARERRRECSLLVRWRRRRRAAPAAAALAAGARAARFDGQRGRIGLVCRDDG
ncbi:MAG: MFS transporter [Myxococcota bacterium]|nr:MFS transporter [Myxococcota bacterium]